MHGYRLIAVAASLAALLAPSLASARGGGRDEDEVRVAAVCQSGARGELRLRADDGEIRVEFELRRRSAERWRLTLVHEHRVVWRATVRTGRSDRSLRVRETVRDLPGADELRMRALGPGGVSCAAGATLAARPG